MIIGTALGFSDWSTIALAVALAFLFGYSLTSLPLLRAGLALAAVVPIALAADTFCIAVMEIVDNAIMLAIPGAMEAGVGDLLFWGALSVALVVAGVVAFPVNRWLITRGKVMPCCTRAATTRTSRPAWSPSWPRQPPFRNDRADRRGAVRRRGQDEPWRRASREAGRRPGRRPAGPAFAARPGSWARGHRRRTDARACHHAAVARRAGAASLSVGGEDGRAVRDFDVEHGKGLHLIVVRDDLRGFQHLHPRMSADGSWSTPVTLREPGSYRLFADFKRQGQDQTLARTLTVEGAAEPLPLPAPSGQATTATGYTVHLSESLDAGSRVLSFHFARHGQTVELQDYLAAKGHLVAVRDRDLAYVHTHPRGGGGGHSGAHAGHGGAHAGHGAPPGGAVPFETAFPSGGRYRLFFQFKHEGRVHAAAFTHQVSG